MNTKIFALVLASLISNLRINADSFHFIPYYPESGYGLDYPIHLSGDGSTVYGRLTQEGEKIGIGRWTKSRGVEKIDVPFTYQVFTVEGVSYDGKSIYGRMAVDNPFELFYWNEDKGFYRIWTELLKTYVPNDDYIQLRGFGISGDGKKVVFSSLTHDKNFIWGPDHPARHFAEDDYVHIIPGDSKSLSSDGRWFLADNKVFDTTVQSGVASQTLDKRFSVISSDGEYIAGHPYASLGPGYMYIYERGVNGFEPSREVLPPEGYTQIEVDDMSNNSAIIGRVAQGYSPFYWTSIGGFTLLADFLPSKGIPNSQYIADGLVEISDNGNTFLGTGKTAQGKSGFWVLNASATNTAPSPEFPKVRGMIRSSRFPSRSVKGINIVPDIMLDRVKKTGADGAFSYDSIPFNEPITFTISHPDWWVNTDKDDEIQVNVDFQQGDEDIVLDLNEFQNKGQASISFSSDKETVRPGEVITVTLSLSNLGLPLVDSDSYLDLSFSGDAFEVGQLTGNGWNLIEHYAPGSTIYTAEGGTMVAEEHLVSAARLGKSFSLTDKFEVQIPLTVKAGVGNQLIELKVRGTIGDHITPDVADGRPTDQQGYFYWSLPIVVIDDVSDLPNWSLSPENGMSVSVYLEGRNGDDYIYPIFFPLLAPFDGDKAAAAAFENSLFFERDNLYDFNFRKSVFKGLIREMVTQSSDAAQKLAVAQALIQTGELALADEQNISDLLSLLASYDIENETQFSQIPTDATYALKLAETLANGVASGAIPADELPALNSLGMFFDGVGIGFTLLDISATAAFYEAISTDLALKRLDYLEQQNPFKSAIRPNTKDEAWEDAIDEVRADLRRVIDGNKWDAYFLAWQDKWPEVAEGGLKVVYGALTTTLNIGWSTVPIAWDYFFKESIAYEDAFFLATAAMKISGGLRTHGAVHPFRNEIILAAESIVYRSGIAVIDNQTFFNGFIFSTSTDVDFPTLRAQYSSKKSQVDQAYANASIPLGHAVVGTITDSSGSPLSGITLTLSNGGGQTTSREDGQYFAMVLPGWAGGVTPTFSTGSFTPAQRSYSSVSGNVLGVDFEYEPPAPTPAWTITGTSSPSSAGLVNGDGRFLEGQTVTLRASALAGYRFDQWTGAGNLPDPTATRIEVSATANMTVTANFIKQWTLSVTSADPSMGSVTGDGGLMDDQATGSITAAANAGYRFDRWEGTGVDSTTNETATVTMDQNRILVAHFVLNTTDGYNRRIPLFGGETDPARIGPLADFDNDGKPNLLEYAYGLNAATGDPENPVKSEAPRKSGSDLHGRFRIGVRSDDPELSYTVGVTSNLSSWTQVPISFNGTNWVSAQPGVLAIASQTDLGNGLWMLVIEDAAAITDQPCFYRSDVTTPYE